MKKLILILMAAISSSALADNLMQQTIEQNNEIMQQGYDAMRDIDQQRYEDEQAAYLDEINRRLQYLEDSLGR